MSSHMPKLLDDYNKKIKLDLSDILGISNVMRIPKILKVSVNIGFGQARLNENQLKAAVEELTTITGQKAIITRAKKAISNFKIRENDPVGIKVTLRSFKMYEFLERFIYIASPRIRDFRGLSSNGFDGHGNYNFGITEQIIFPEIDYDKVKRVSGMNINIVTSANNDYEGYKLLLAIGLPIKENKKLENNNN